MADRLTHMQTIKNGLEALRPILQGLEDSGYLTLFDEFLDQSEFGLALHCICDYLLEPQTAPRDTATIECIATLHSAMEIEDDCVELLQAKTKSAV
jgi:hypothetical protein